MVLGLLNQGVSMRTEVDISELENHTDELLERVEKGETIVITLRGEPIADPVPHELKTRRGDSRAD
jgi:antitoxin (DNA-binding transcriptional repressor) of toxin-antitoxin stability system